MATNTAEIYIGALADREKSLQTAHADVIAARARYIVAVRSYAATRDLFKDIFGESLYGDACDYRPLMERQVPDSGRFRFVAMDPGEAVKEILADAQHPMSLSEIALGLRRGGFGLDEDAGAIVSRRGVNAALMRTAGITKTDDDLYELEAEEAD